MPTKREIEVYQFDELPPKAKERAITAYRHAGHAWDSHNTEMLTDFFKEQLDALGLPSGDIRWHFSYSQGDGMAFYGKFDLEGYIKANKLKGKYGALTRGKEPATDYIAASIEKIGMHMYDHYNTMRTILELTQDLTPAQDALVRELEEHINEQIAGLSHKMEKEGYAEIEYVEGDEQISEMFNANDFEFDVHGDRI